MEDLGKRIVKHDFQSLGLRPLDSYELGNPDKEIVLRKQKISLGGIC